MRDLPTNWMVIVICHELLQLDPGILDQDQILAVFLVAFLAHRDSNLDHKPRLEVQKVNLEVRSQNLSCCVSVEPG